MNGVTRILCSRSPRHRLLPALGLALALLSLGSLAATGIALNGDSAHEATQQQGQGSLLGPPLYVRLVDAYSGAPITGAPVQMVGVPQLKTTDALGYAMFRKQGGHVGDVATVWTTPQGYAPSSKRVALTASMNFTTMFIPPANLFTTGLIDPLVGGHYVFNAPLPTSDPTPFFLELTVPAGALPEAMTINITPYPPIALWDHGIPATYTQFGAVHINVTDASGQPASESLNLPVTFRARGYAAGGNLSLYNTSTLRLYRYDYVANEWANDSAPASIDLATNTFTVQTSHFSILTGCSQAADIGGVTPPGLSIVPDGHKCEDKCQVPVHCGIRNGNCSITGSESSQVTVSASLSTELNANYGESIGNDKIAQISASVGASLKGSVSGSITGTTSMTVSGSISEGQQSGNPCFSGSDHLYLISNVFSVRIAGVEAGRVTVPAKILVYQERVFDSSCCEQAVSPVGLPQLPDDCE